MKTHIQTENSHHARDGFTLLELLAVLAIMGLMSGLAVVSFVSYKDGLALRQALLTTKSGIAQTRQWAITRRQKTRFRYNNITETLDTRGYYVLETVATGEIVGQTNWLPKGVVFDAPETIGPLVFKLDGSLESDDLETKVLTLTDSQAKANNKVNWKQEIEVLPLTGFARVKHTRIL